MKGNVPSGQKTGYEKFQIKKFSTIQKLVQRGYNVPDRTGQYDIVFKLKQQLSYRLRNMLDQLETINTTLPSLKDGNYYTRLASI